MRELQRCSGSQFDPQVVKALLGALETDDELRSLLPTAGEAPLAAAPAARPSVTPLPSAAVDRGA